MLPARDAEGGRDGDLGQSDKSEGGGNWPENVLISLSDFLLLKNSEMSESLCVMIESPLMCLLEGSDESDWVMDPS